MTFPYAQFGLMIVTLFAMTTTTVAQDDLVLLSDSFEPSDGEDAAAPVGWREGVPVPGVRYLWAGGNVPDGERALSLKKTANRYFPVAEWSRTVEHRGEHNRLDVKVQVKARRTTKATVDLQFIDSGGQWSHEWVCYIGAKNAGDPPANHDWKVYTGSVDIPPNTERIGIGLQIYGPGQVWFDQLELAYADGAQKPPQPRRDPVASNDEPNPIALEVKDGVKGEYLLVEPTGDPPADGFPLIVVLPGGDGSADFHPFVHRIQEHALDGRFIVAQPIAKKWTPDQQITWPTVKHPVDDLKFSTEAHIAKVITDVAGRHPLDTKRIYVLAWSSGGPAAYATLMWKGSPVAGGLIAMSVFKPDSLPPLEGAAGKRFFLLHSPDDRVCPYWMAEAAEKTLAEAGATCTLVDYAGGHGWHGDVYGNIRRGIEWLEEGDTPRE